MRQILFNWFCVIISLTGSCCISAQCPTFEDYIQFNSQAEVNQFLIDYPNCTSIEGRLIIGSNNTSDITDLNPLQNLISTQGLLIQSTSLTNLEGLENLTSNNGELAIRYNNNLTDLSALGGVREVFSLDIDGNNVLTSIEGLNLETINSYVEITQNPSLVNLEGLEALTQIPDHFEIRLNSALTSLQGLQSLNQIGALSITFNNSLTNVDGLSSLISLTGATNSSGINISNNANLISLQGLSQLNDISNSTIQISSNSSLTSLAGLDNINPNSITNLWITSSQDLSTCNVSSICDYLSAGGTATISGNSVGCNSVQEVEEFCEGSAGCYDGDVYLVQQNQVELYAEWYPDCTTIYGDLYIGTEEGTANINDLSGLQNIENITGSIIIKNTSLNNLSGLNSLVQIGGDLVISGNDNLQEIEALSALTTISASSIIIEGNDALTSLSGLDNINPESITGLTLSSSQNLSTCDVESICTYISTFGSEYTISGNAVGCNSFEEVLEACQGILLTCPAVDTQFLSQEELDHFVIQYPNCSTFNGNLRIGGTSVTDISDLEALNNLTQINGSLSIEKTSLINLNGLENLNQTGNLQVLLNDQLESLDGLDNLSNVIGGFTIQSNPSLFNFESLHSLLTVYDLNIIGNESLSSLEGLNNLMATTNPDGGTTSISNNSSLIDLKGLESLQQISGILRIDSNENLSSLDGLENLQLLTDNLEIKSNPNLQSIESLTGLTEVPFLLQISTNPELESLQGLQNLVSTYIFDISGNHSLVNLDGLNSLESAVDIIISDNDGMTSLEGLNSLFNVTGKVDIYGNELLNNIENLSNLEIVGALLIHDNPSLVSLQGTHNINTIGYEWPGSLAIYGNPLLSSLEPLTNLETLNGGYLFIQNSPGLTNLNGLGNIDPDSMMYLEIITSQNLSACNVPSICSYLSNGGEHVIDGNATGCNSSEEILDLCELSIEEISDENQITLYPVPTNQILNISVQNSTKIESVNVYDMTGKLVLSSINFESKINISHLNSGTYLVSVKTNKGIHTEKIIKK